MKGVAPRALVAGKVAALVILFAAVLAGVFRWQALSARRRLALDRFSSGGDPGHPLVVYTGCSLGTGPKEALGSGVDDLRERPAIGAVQVAPGYVAMLYNETHHRGACLAVRGAMDLCAEGWGHGRVKSLRVVRDRPGMVGRFCGGR